ncbi:MAG: TraR/DksA C4-type zinc finger protein [Acidimicrobiales bacterium]|nr:TraR/DksA C4-type zinc finger protein [Acidimicrobiales bacterium]MCB1247991.1 TraR/DksA C4-type zinc finger protein [Acidimicrobiales bacterium]MCB1260049.1 TraR/DksA C4-type zinc finger protein [Acidimicrobiales bacterium]
MNGDDQTDAAARPALEAEREALSHQLVELSGDETTDFDDNFADSGQVSAEHTEARTLAASLREQLDDVDRALGKLDDGTYGSCEVCGATIPDERLAAMPATRFCIEHAG